MEEKRSYYAVIPANVRYDKSLSANAKLLYSEITSLCNDKGYCWASNKYFADLYGVSQKSISNWISTLVGKGYLFMKMIYREGTREILERHLSMEPMEENFYTPMEKKFHTPMEEKFQENTKDINTKGTNKSINQSDKNRTDKLTDEVRIKLKRQIDYNYFEENFPEDVSGVDALIDCMAEMLLSPSTKINGSLQPRTVLMSYIDKVDSESVRGLLEHMRGKKMRHVQNVGAYWKSAFINFLRAEELAKLTV
jgi:hypothetical protein